MTKQEIQDKVLKVKDTLDEIAKKYKVEFHNLEEQHKFDNIEIPHMNLRRQGSDGCMEARLIEWFFLCNNVYCSLVSREGELSQMEYTMNKSRSIRDIYITINTCSGHKIEDFGRFMNYLTVAYPFYYCGTIHKIVFHPYNTTNPLNGEYQDNNDYYIGHADSICENTKLTSDELLWLAHYSDLIFRYNHGGKKLREYLGIPEKEDFAGALDRYAEDLTTFQNE